MIEGFWFTPIRDGNAGWQDFIRIHSIPRIGERVYHNFYYYVVTDVVYDTKEKVVRVVGVYND